MSIYFVGCEFAVYICPINNNQKHKAMKKFTLTKTETGKKSQKYLYTVTDENGNVLSTRGSNRDYVACTISGSYFFGRLDLIGKGDHGRNLKHAQKQIADVEKDIQKKSFAEYVITYYKTKENYIKETNEVIERLTSIAYL